MTDADRLLTAARRPEDVDAALRPKSLDDFVGQKAARENLRVFIAAAKARGEALDHVLFFGPPGLGKTTLAQIVAREMGVGFRATSGPVIAKSGTRQPRHRLATPAPQPSSSTACPGRAGQAAASITASAPAR